ncbi:hypothetical protein Cgig2_025589 [Carnegiea gigantea]|uniref:Uncharacterized protein n=1 Tax=Carnegiea gigantea TaxID=171969 RepID=A0A9Q1Q4H2_9CARY|nr:hypothetical protein Cgig2_025589 [Carnegiea gigantea]
METLLLWQAVVAVESLKYDREMVMELEVDGDVRMFLKGSDEHGYLYVGESDGPKRRTQKATRTCDDGVVPGRSGRDRDDMVEEGWEYSVELTNSCKLVVKLGQQTGTCRMWHMRVDAKMGRVVDGDELDDDYDRCILPPTNGRQLGRPPSKCKESQTHRTRSRRCSKCGEVGHTRRTYRNPCADFDANYEGNVVKVEDLLDGSYVPVCMFPGVRQLEMFTREEADVHHGKPWSAIGKLMGNYHTAVLAL